jgi:hypothetical protein
MPTLSREYRKLLENTVASARESAVAGARKALTALRVGDKEAPTDPDQKALRAQLRAHGRQLGDSRQLDGTQETRRLEQACAYEHWHRLLFARFLAENDLLVNPDYGVAMSLAEVQEAARAQNQDWLGLASDYAQRMLIEVFRPDDPVLRLSMPPETRQELEALLAGLPSEIFTADDSLGWVYQYWQRDEKKRVNALEIPIGAEELSPVTQLFTEDYMVLFLLHNTLGAWWAAKRRAEGKTHELRGYEWAYLRLNDNGSPAAGQFEGWPRRARDLRILDPCMGSGHFLTFALPILARMRQEEEVLSDIESVRVVLTDNLFGLELDARCSQIAAFNLALTAWRTVGKTFALPSLNLSCSGLGINASQESWLALAGDDRRLKDTLSEFYSMFRLAPTLGSLIDPTRVARPLLMATFEEVWPLMEVALSAEQASDEIRELAIAAKGVLTAGRTLGRRFTLVATNVPYLGRNKQNSDLKAYAEEFYPTGKADLATCFVERCLRFCDAGGTVGLVTPQNWTYLTTYKHLRERLLRYAEWNLVANLGPNAFQDMNWWAATTALVVLTNSTPSTSHELTGIDTSDVKQIPQKTQNLRLRSQARALQSEQFKNPASIIRIAPPQETPQLGTYATCFQGISSGDSDRLIERFWENQPSNRWRPFQTPPDGTMYFGGRECLIDWQVLESGFESAAIRGTDAWGKRGILVGQMRALPATLFCGDLFSTSTPVLIPRDEAYLEALWCFCTSPEFGTEMRKINPGLVVANGYVGKIPFDLTRWQGIAEETFPNGLPAPDSDDPTQWLFSGNPRKAIHPLQVAVARLVGYEWPRQTGAQFLDCPPLDLDGLDQHTDLDGIVCLNSSMGEPAAADRLRALLAAAFGTEWSAQKLRDQLGSSESLDSWLRDKFFEEHCRVFQNRPFVWHIWDGRRDGFHAFVNYHRLAGPNGAAKKTLEKLIYTSLGSDWIKRQQAEVTDGKDGAEARLAAALHLQSELEKILHGEPPYDIFVRWKPLHEQPLGWEPDLNDGVRLNMRPWLNAKPYQEPNQKLRQGASILRVTPIKMQLGKDRGKEPLCDKEDFPWYATSSDRTNDEHFTLEQKRAARERRKKA